ncbi:hypothetical protein LMH73_008720 [Vibrio splendidus]|nr:hypothetical protein [Vibrio splendidus]MCC4879450.1 hypothetical protein [Vibrio splendidus]
MSNSKTQSRVALIKSLSIKQQGRTTLSKSLLPAIIDNGFKFVSIADPQRLQCKTTVVLDKGLIAKIWMAFNGTFVVSIKCPEFNLPHIAQVYVYEDELCLIDVNFNDTKLERNIAFYSPRVISGYDKAAYAMAVLVDTVSEVLNSDKKDEILSETLRVRELWMTDAELKKRASLGKMKHKLK